MKEILNESDARTCESKFPLYVFPESMQKIVNSLHVERKFPIDYLCGAILFVISVLIGAKINLHTAIMRSFANIYVALVGLQGANKSAPVQWATSILHELDAEAIGKYKQAMAQYELHSLKFRNGQTSVDPGPKPVCKRYLVNDTTPEVLFSLLESNERGIGQYFDELSKMFVCTGRYSKMNSEEIYLSLFSNSTINVDRKTSDSTYSIVNPYYSLIGTIQPQVFIKLMSASERFDNGLLSRFLLVPHFDEPALLWNLDPDFPQTDSDLAYREIIYSFIKIRDTMGEVEYTLDADAANIIEGWQNAHEIRIEESGSDIERAIFRKIQIYVFKFSLILQMLNDVCGRVKNEEHLVNGLTAINATTLADYFFKQAMEFAQIIARPYLTAKEQELYNLLPDSFSTETGRSIASNCGIKKTAFHAFLNKIKGTLLIQPMRGIYRKTAPSYTNTYRSMKLGELANYTGKNTVRS
ncbi:MAG: DUF3987 domain-containing protein [Prevotellaceae bacterium]|nr:DUF3987 domain-containing protein [Candidatus Faecinaster equi]